MARTCAFDATYTLTDFAPVQRLRSLIALGRAREEPAAARRDRVPYAKGNGKEVSMRISDERDRPFRDRDRRFRQRDRAFRERDRADRKAGLALRMTSTTRAMLPSFCRREHARAPDEHAHDQGRFTT
jgi:hypothetical protein